jgi:hypothetical protein
MPVPHICSERFQCRCQKYRSINPRLIVRVQIPVAVEGSLTLAVPKWNFQSGRTKNLWKTNEAPVKSRARNQLCCARLLIKFSLLLQGSSDGVGRFEFHLHRPYVSPHVRCFGSSGLRRRGSATGQWRPIGPRRSAGRGSGNNSGGSTCGSTGWAGNGDGIGNPHKPTDSPRQPYEGHL